MKFKPFVHCLYPAYLFMLLFAFTATAAAETVVWTGSNDQKVWLDASGSRQKNRHPYKISPQTLSRFLVSLEISENNKKAVRKGNRTPLFSEGKANELAQLLAKALRKVRPNQDVFFQINDTEEGFAAFLGNEVVSGGRAFVDVRGYLNIIFGEIKKGYKEKWLFGQKVDQRVSVQTGERSKARRLQFRIQPVSGLRFAKRSNGKRRQDWIIFDPRVSLQADSKPTSAGFSGLEERLRRLKRLRASGLISPEIYNAEVKKLLKNL